MNHQLTREGVYASDGTVMGMKTRCSCGKASPTLTRGAIADKLLSWERLHRVYTKNSDVIYGPDPFWSTSCAP